MIPARPRLLQTAYRRFRHDAETLAQLLTQPPTEQSAEEVKRTLRALKRDVQLYYERIEPQSFVQEIGTRAPYLRRQLEAWQRRHQKLMQQLEQTCKQLRQRRNHFDAVRPKLQSLVSELLHHEAERDQLVYQSFYPEPTAID